ncbi:MAG: penicillin acylase family protein [Candidatus Eisenbacteria bacterium]|uniref:Penicillin acylase family protein n=1 Tax=Eiseniibacteriota bacterium TaxID=2212470 RepID=A0A849SQK8_UNCEI|nr:penicillin acylase family protein [Candidatus Eisenbacteria bacterium]
MLERALLASWAAQRDTLLPIEGVGATVRIVTDRNGVPHVSAQSLADLYFGWGFVTARDRAWQLEHLRRSAHGTMWEWFGNRSLRADGGAQLFELPERASTLWARDRADSNVRSALESYVAGINACFALNRAGAIPWAPEFTTLRRYPTDWVPEDVYIDILAQAFVLDFDADEFDEADELKTGGLERFEARRRFEGEQVYTTIPDSAARRLYGAPDSQHVAVWSAAPRPIAPALAMLVARARADLAPWVAPLRDPEQRASNVFAVGANRSASGRPLLANDPHLPLGAPGTLYAVHLHCTAAGLDAIGAGAPGVPVLVSGRNRAMAWGLTTLSADLVDVYADTISSDGSRVRFGDGWVPVREGDYRMRFRALGVFDLPTFGQKRRYTPHGPVVAWDRKSRLALSVKWAGSDSSFTLRELVGIERETDARRGARRFGTLVRPAFNWVVADSQGHVEYQVAGALPRRNFRPGPGPLPSDGRHEWSGERIGDHLPHWEVPSHGFVANGNNLPIGAAYPERLPRYDWLQDRALRIAERLSALETVSLDDLERVQGDRFSRPSQRVRPRLVACADSIWNSLGAREREAVDSLRRWDGLAQRDRVGPTLYRAWYGAFLRRSGFEAVPGLALAALDGRAPEALRRPGTDSLERAAVAAVAALDTALARLTAHLGETLSTWTWERAHRARFKHELAWRDSAFAPPSQVMDGDNSTPSVGASRLPWSTTVVHGPMWRHLVDLAVPGVSWAVLPPGNSGRGPHARDLLDAWSNREYIPLHLDWSRIDELKESEWRLEPRGRR